jgi:hypothetical protein
VQPQNVESLPVPIHNEQTTSQPQVTKKPSSVTTQPLAAPSSATILVDDGNDSDDDDASCVPSEDEQVSSSFEDDASMSDASIDDINGNGVIEDVPHIMDLDQSGTSQDVQLASNFAALQKSPHIIPRRSSNKGTSVRSSEQTVTSSDESL